MPGDILLIGGAEDKTGNCQILNEFLDKTALAGPIAILTTASYYPAAVGRGYKMVFRRLGARDVYIVPIQNQHDAEATIHLTDLKQAGSYFFVGGSQTRISEAMLGTSALRLIRERWQQGMVIAGSSAGAAALGSFMITSSYASSQSDPTSFDVIKGLGFLENMIVDQHFTERGRLHRLQEATRADAALLGLGIDENTAVWIGDSGHYIRILGEHQVTTVKEGQVADIWKAPYYSTVM